LQPDYRRQPADRRASIAVRQSQLAACPVNFVAMTGPAIEKLLHENLYYI